MREKPGKAYYRFNIVDLILFQGGIMKLLKVLCVLALAISVTGLVYAETQSVKISGDLDVRSIMRGAYNLQAGHMENNTWATPAGVQEVRTGNQDDWQTYFMSTTEVQIDTDLTDNVSAAVRLFNQRDWNVRAKSVDVTTAPTAGYTSNSEEFDVGVNLAYIELKEFLYSPLTLKIGRQNIWFGKVSSLAPTREILTTTSTQKSIQL